ncbi:MAG: nuclear transport factor 2 family protein [Pleurocapsa sp.]
MKTVCSALVLSLGLFGGLNLEVKAETAATAPPELTEVISKLESAANNKDLEEVIEYYSPDFTNEDGLTRSSLAQSLSQMWKTYPRMRYITTIDSWSDNGDELIAETTTQIRGLQNNRGRIISFDSTLRSRQYFQDQKLVRQEILSEQTKLTSGDNPPQVSIIAPETVELGEKYNFDVVVIEPLGDRVLLGAVKEERTSSDLYLHPTALELEPLPAGGVYKTVTAPLLPDNNWLSAIVVRGDGITMVTHRVRVKEQDNLAPQ